MLHGKRNRVAASLLAIAAVFGVGVQARADELGRAGAGSGSDLSPEAREELERVQALARLLREHETQRTQLAETLRGLSPDSQRVVQASLAEAQEAQLRAHLREDRRERSQREELHGSDIFFPPTNAGSPGECNRDPIPSMPTLELPPRSLPSVLNELEACYFALMDRGDPYLNRRVAYSGVSSVGALGAAIGGSAAATSTTAAWGGLALLPILIEGTFDRPEFDALDRVTARGLHWVNGRAVQMDALQRRLQQQSIALQVRIEAVEKQLESDGNARLQTLAEPPEAQADEADVAVSAAAARRMRTQVRSALSEAAMLRDLTNNTAGAIGSELSPWALAQFDVVMDNYRSKRLDMTMRPQAAARSIIALPFTTLANLLRGGQNFQAEDYFAARAAADLTGLDRPLNLPGKPAAVAATSLEITQEEFPEDDRDHLVLLQDETNRLIGAMNATLGLLTRADSANTARSPSFLSASANANQTQEAATDQRLAAPPPPPPPTQKAQNGKL